MISGTLLALAPITGAPTRFIQTGLLEKVTKPVIHMPLMLDFEPPPPIGRSRFNLPKNKFPFFSHLIIYLL
jgi:hypothetical protein